MNCGNIKQISRLIRMRRNQIIRTGIYRIVYNYRLPWKHFSCHANTTPKETCSDWFISVKITINNDHVCMDSIEYNTPLNP